MFSIGVSLSDNGETKLCRISRGVHSFSFSPAFVTTWRKGGAVGVEGQGGYGHAGRGGRCAARRTV
ncbi:hypothetical protein GCM10010116_60650 [Microbispora rosea subsp. aerata]|nr:hypothetical protein GCM10010116_60650 [Microbispora rosea subsp. aerata]GIH59038.1 hypothetical protein Mro02_59520 [Microbispora rosea subsp. aerata]GLJ87386.1 hypothetical protein GCM10017588_61310 [Microbispora rosea subsp. aerata]